MSLYKSFMLPEDSRAVRIPTYPVVEKTALVELVTPNSLTVTTSNSTNDFRMILFRQGGIPLWANVGPNTMVWQASWGMATDSPGNTGEFITVLPTTTDSTFGNKVPSSLSNAGAFGALSPYLTPFVPLASSRKHGCSYVYVPFNCHVAVVISSGYVASGICSGFVTLETNDNQKVIVDVACVAGNTALSGTTSFAGAPSPFINKGQWVRPVHVNLTSGLGSFNENASVILVVANAAMTTVNSNSTTQSADITVGAITTGSIQGPVMPLIMNPELPNTPIPFKECRVGGLGLRLMNSTKILNKEGTIQVSRHPPTVDPFRLSKVQASAVTESDKKTFLMQDGLYVTTIPGSDLNEFKNYTHLGVGTEGPWIPTFDLDDQAHSTLVFLSDPDGATSMLASVATHFEFRSPSQLYQTALASATLEDMHRAVLHMTKAGVFFPTGDLPAIRKMVNNGAPRSVQSASRRIPLPKAPSNPNVKKPKPKPPKQQPKKETNGGKTKEHNKKK